MASMTTSDSFQMSTQSYPDQGYSQNAGYSQNTGYSQNSADPNNKTMWNWLTQNKLVNTFVEKAKVSLTLIEFQTWSELCIMFCDFSMVSNQS